jgi:hypothetical protein
LVVGSNPTGPTIHLKGFPHFDAITSGDYSIVSILRVKGVELLKKQNLAITAKCEDMLAMRGADAADVCGK